ncbi:unnamed protein product, partial [Scytosiphon promiscuus]
MIPLIFALKLLCNTELNNDQQVFVDALGDAPVHARRLLFGTLVDSLGDDSLAILSALLLRR